MFTAHLDEAEVLAQEELFVIDLVSQQIADWEFQVLFRLSQHLSLCLVEHFHG